MFGSAGEEEVAVFERRCGQLGVWWGQPEAAMPAVGEASGGSHGAGLRRFRLDPDTAGGEGGEAAGYVVEHDVVVVEDGDGVGV